VALYAASRERSLEDVRQTLSDLIDNFEADAPRNRTLLRELLDSDRALFYSGAIQALKKQADSRGGQYLVALLVANGMLLEAICDPALNREQALALARSAIRTDPAADAGLARGLADSQTGQGSVVIDDPPRLMEVLCEVGDPSRMMASMMRLLRHPNPYLRSKAVKVVGRGSKSPKWVRQRLSDPDPRIRANAIEALWGVDTSEAKGLLQFAATEDNHNRVKANALLGLYYLGDCSSLGALVNMAADESSVVRSSAAWAMGESGDVRFQDALRRLLNDPDPVVRKRAFSALARVKTSSQQVANGAKWHVAARASSIDAKGGRRALVAVAGDNATEQPVIPSLGFLLSENNLPILSYRVNERPAPDAMSVVFVLPREPEAAAPLREAIESCLKWKRTSDLWCILPYIESGDGAPPEAVGDPDAPAFAANPETLRKVLSEPARRVECWDLWSTVWRAAKLEGNAARGIRHILILSTVEESRLAGHGVVAKARNPRVQVQALATAGNRRVQEFCKEIRASFKLADPADIGEMIRRAYLTLLARYEISYQPVVANAPGLKVRIQGQGGSGEASVPYPAEAESEVPPAA
jgi:HEAT repeat protein